MPFKVKAILKTFLGDTKRYPCHFLHKVGDEIIWDGEKLIGRVCPDVLPRLIPYFHALRCAGPRYKDPSYYLPFWYASLSVIDPHMKKFDGLGFKPVKEKIIEPPYHVATLIAPGAFEYPPPKERVIRKDITVICPDVRTSAVFKVEAFDLSDAGYDVPYFRREMVILHKVIQKSGIETDKILNEFSKEEIEDIYPPLSPVMVQALLEELELVGYVELIGGKVYATQKGKLKLDEFKASLTAEEKEALRL